MISLKNIKKNYYLSKTNVINVLKGVSIDFREHEFVSILGPSGCGKTTLLNVIGGLDVFESGDIVIDGVSTAQYKASDWDNYRNKRVGFVFQSYNLIPHLNVVRNVEMPLILTGIKKAECRRRAVEVLKLVGLEEQIYKRPLQLSGGQMQRVALARALITNPDIILADEPTGALDNESSEVVMSLLKKVASDRLVIMVTHNDLLAKEYSTRIINLNGGVVAGDSDPYVPEEALPAEAPERPASEAVAEPVETVETPKKPAQKRKKRSRLSFFTAVELSFKTLLSKKVRTGLTSFAGSIGIIGILLVLAFSQGVNGYIAGMEESSLSMYPLTIEQTQISVSSLLSKLTGAQDNDREEYPKEDAIYTNKIIGGILQDITSLTAINDLPAFKQYLDENFDESLGYVKYDYGVTINAYAKDPKIENQYMKVEPFLDVMTSSMQKMGIGNNSMIDMIKMYAGNMSSWSEMMDNRDLLHSQYDLIGKSRWPRSEVYRDENGDWVTEVVMIADEKNQFKDYTLFMLGLLSENDLGGIMSGNTDVYDKTFTSADLIGKEYYILANSDYYAKEKVIENSEEKGWLQYERTEQSADFVENHFAVKAKVVGIIRPNRNASAVAMAGAIGYDPSLTSFLIRYIDESPIVTAERATYIPPEEDEYNLPYWQNLATGAAIRSQASFDKLMVEMGVADMSEPERILIYANSFESKNKIIEFIEDYNKNAPEGKEVKYTDNLSAIMGFVMRMSDVIEKVLIGFTSVSLIVSSIMIAVIIYTSVLERRKEVGILRSVGARKRDIVMIFMAESGILGLSSGLLGALIAWLITLPVNAILASAVGIGTLASLTWGSVFGMIGVSFLLSVAAGVVPAFIGAKQDPAVALRTE